MAIKNVQDIFLRQTYSKAGYYEEIRMILHLNAGNLKLEFWQDDPEQPKIDDKLSLEEKIEQNQEEMTKILNSYGMQMTPQILATMNPLVTAQAEEPKENKKKKKKKEVKPKKKLLKLKEVKKEDSYYLACSYKDMYGHELNKKLYSIKPVHKKIALQKAAEKYGYYVYNKPLSTLIWAMLMNGVNDYHFSSTSNNKGFLYYAPYFEKYDSINVEHIKEYLNIYLKELIRKQKELLIKEHYISLPEKLYAIYRKYVDTGKKLGSSQQSQLDHCKDDLFDQWILQNIHKDITLEKLISEENRNNPEYMIKLIAKNNQINWDTVSEKLKLDRNFMDRAFHIDNRNIVYAHPNLLNDKEFIKKYLIINFNTWHYVSEELKNNIPLIIDVLKAERNSNIKGFKKRQIRQSWFYNWHHFLSKEIVQNLPLEITDEENIAKLMHLQEKRLLQARLEKNLNDTEFKTRKRNKV